MSADLLLGKLDGVRRTGPGRWVTKCPAHEDRRPSLSVRELQDGRMLLHCFAGCPTDEVVSALGMDMSCLFPARTAQGYSSVRRPFVSNDALRSMSRDALFVAVAAEAVAAGDILSVEDRRNLNEAAARFREGVRAVTGGIR